MEGITSSPPPGFVPAAAAGRPSSSHTAGTKSIEIKAESINFEVLGRSQMQNEIPTTQRSCQAKSSLVENKNASPAKGTKRKYVVGATKGKRPWKHRKLEDHEDATGLGRLQTPVDLFEDECVFCHSFRTGEVYGPVLQYLQGRIVSSDKGNSTNTIYVHEKCMTWAPKVRINGDTIVNMEKEISRAKGKKCSRCKLLGAALGCCLKSCTKNYHVPCALMIPECRWDVKSRLVWCPQHAPRDEMGSPVMESDILSPVLQNQCPAKEISDDFQMEVNQINPLPSNEVSSPIMENDIPSAVLRNQCSAKEISADCQTEDEQINPLVTSNSSLPGQVADHYLDKEGISVVHRREDLQVDQLNISSSSLPQGQCSDKEGISANCRREEKLVNQSSTPVDQWVLLGIALTASEKDSLKQFASLTSSTLAEEWNKTVTHVIVGRNAGQACGRSYEVPMAILSGKWVVAAGWVADCLVGSIQGSKPSLPKPIPGPEIFYEVKFFDGQQTSIDGPTKGRAAANEGAPKLFSGLHFCLSTYMRPEDRENIRNLIAAGEGKVLEGVSPDSLPEIMNINPAKVYFIYNGGPPKKSTSDFKLGFQKEVQESIEYANSGVQVISHLSLYDAILSYDTRILEPNGLFTKICE